MKQENWLLCHVHTYEYFDGVTRLLIPDNLKMGVTANTRYETQLNESYREMAEYYGTSIVPARVRKPQDKSSRKICWFLDYIYNRCTSQEEVFLFCGSKSCC